jgi:hypothetical protein
LSFKEGKLVARVGGGYSPFDAFLRSLIPPKLVKRPKTVPKKVKEEPQPNKIIIMRNINNPNFMSEPLIFKFNGLNPPMPAE